MAPYTPLRERVCGNCERFIFSASRQKYGICEKFGEARTKKDFPKSVGCFSWTKAKAVYVMGKKIKGQTVASSIDAMKRMGFITIPVLASFIMTFEEYTEDKKDIAYHAARAVIRQQMREGNLKLKDDGYEWEASK